MAEYPLLTELLDLTNVSVTHYQLVGQNRINLFLESAMALGICAGPRLGRKTQGWATQRKS